MNCFVFWYHCKHIFGRKNCALLIDLLKVKNTILHCRVYIEENDRQMTRVETVTVQWKQLHLINFILFQIATQITSI